jgi:hypothetical protein
MRGLRSFGDPTAVANSFPESCESHRHSGNCDHSVHGVFIRIPIMAGLADSVNRELCNSVDGMFVTAQAVNKLFRAMFTSCGISGSP